MKIDGGKKEKWQKGMEVYGKELIESVRKRTLMMEIDRKLMGEMRSVIDGVIGREADD